MIRKLTHKEIVARQQDQIKKKRLSFSVVLNNVRSLYNVGSIFRTADGAGVEKIWLCGITGCPPNNQISKTALGAEDVICWEYCKDVNQVIAQLKKQHYQIVLLEQMTESIPYDEYVPEFPVCLILGNEIEGVQKGIVEQCDRYLEIEMSGIKNSLNVSVAFGIVAYHIKKCLGHG